MKRIMIALCVLLIAVGVMKFKVIDAAESESLKNLKTRFTQDVNNKNQQEGLNNFYDYIINENLQEAFADNNFVSWFKKIFTAKELYAFLIVDKIIKELNWVTLKNIFMELDNPYILLEEWNLDPNKKLSVILINMLNAAIDEDIKNNKKEEYAAILAKPLMKDKEIDLISLACYLKINASENKKREWDDIFEEIKDILMKAPIKMNTSEEELCLSLSNPEYKNFLDIMAGEDPVNDFAQSLRSIVISN